MEEPGRSSCCSRRLAASPSSASTRSRGGRSAGCCREVLRAHVRQEPGALIDVGKRTMRCHAVAVRIVAAAASPPRDAKLDVAVVLWTRGVGLQELTHARAQLQSFKLGVSCRVDHVHSCRARGATAPSRGAGACGSGCKSRDDGRSLRCGVRAGAPRRHRCEASQGESRYAGLNYYGGRERQPLRRDMERPPLQHTIEVLKIRDRWHIPPL